MSRLIPSLCFTGHRYPDHRELAERVKGMLIWNPVTGATERVG